MKKFWRIGLSLASVLAVMFSVSGVASASGDTAPETDTPMYAADSLKAASAASSLDWNQYDWKAEYITSNLTEWQPMSSADAQQFSFSWNGTHGSQPYVQVKQKEGLETEKFKVTLVANQWASATWWSKAAVTFTAKEDGDFVITCDSMEPVRFWTGEGFAVTVVGANGDGHVTVYKNDVKIWPVDAEYASVTSTNHPHFAPMTVTLAVGDTIRFEGFGGEVGQDVTHNTNDYKNDIFLNPAIAKVKATASSSSSTPSSSSSTSSSSSSVPSSSSSSAVSTNPATTTAAAPKGVTYSAHDSLLESLQAGSVAANALWKPVYLDANCEDGWKDMLVNPESFSMKSMDFALPYIYIPESGGVILNANQWAAGGPYWDKSGVAYTAPKTQKVVLKAGDIKTISAAVEYDQGALSKTEGRVAIYKNGEKIWPANADYAAVQQGKSVDFPELELNLKKGDVIVIEGYGAMPGQEITGNVGGSWQNQILMDPVIYVPGENAGGNPGGADTGVSALPAMAAMLTCAVAAGAAVCTRKRRPC